MKKFLCCIFLLVIILFSMQISAQAVEVTNSDKIAPKIEKITGVQNTNTASGGKVAVTASGIKDEGGSGLARVSWRYKIPGTTENVVQPWTTNTSSTNTYNVPITVEGTYNVVVYVQDKAGNTSKGKSTTIVVNRSGASTDKTAPKIGRITGVQYTNIASGKEVEIVASNITDAGGSGLAKIGLSYRFLPEGSTKWKNWNSFKVVRNKESSYTFKFPVTEEGRYKILVRAYDEAGNYSSGSTTDVYVDRTVPVIGSITGGQYANITSGKEVEIIASNITDAGGSGLAKIGLSYQFIPKDSTKNEAWKSFKIDKNTASSYTFKFPVTKEGKYNILVRAYDATGNYSSGSTTDVYVDRTVPTIGSITGRQYTNIVGGKEVEIIASNIADAGGSGLAKIGLSYQFIPKDSTEKEPWKSFKIDKNTASSYTFKFPVTEEGRYNILVRAYDTAGNYSSGSTTDVYVDRTVPTIGSITGGQYTNIVGGKEVGIIASNITDVGGSGLAKIGLSYQFIPKDSTEKEAWKSFKIDKNTASSYTFKFPITKEGKYNILVRAYDTAGNYSSGSTMHMSYNGTEVLFYGEVDMDNKDNVVIHVINLEQERGDANSDSILIQCGGENVLIDGGRENDAQTVYNYLSNMGVKELKYIFATHEDIDHSQGLSTLLQNYPDISVGAFYSSEYYRTSSTFNVGKILARRGISNLHISVGNVLNVGKAKITCLGPLHEYPSVCKEEGIYYSRENQQSLIIKVELGETSMLFTGDADSTVVSNELLAKYGEELKSDVLWYAHHGIGPKVVDFFNAVRPSYGIASRSSTPAENAFPFLTEEVLKAKKILGTQDYISCNGNIKIGMDGFGVMVTQ